MAPEVSRTDVNDIHPCYEIYNVSYRLTSTPSTICVLIFIFLGSLSVVTVCGNLLVIISIIYFKQLHTPTNSLILSLAVADLLVGLVVFPLSMAFSLSSCLHYEHIDLLLAQILGPIFSFYLPVIIMLCIYLKIFLVAERQARSIRNTTCQSTKCGATVGKHERKATKTLATVMGVFLMCWTPFFLCFTFQLLDNVSVPLPLFETLNWLALSNSMLNPFIYAFFYSWFRSAFRMIISGKIFQGDFADTKLL
uniref:trace amine-associated receptor 7c-like n=1 Tax=Epinephelus lanceolatus TaxID=310571 RepID=UPI0014460B84|nr:trace amine-associated receptor 7c-like [Epinephelus lanceolatus]